MRLVRLAQKFRMELARDEKRMIFQLNHLDQFSVRRKAAENESGLLEFFAVAVVEFFTVTMALVNDKRAVKLTRLGANRQLARHRAEPHGAAFLRHFLLRVEQRDDRMRRLQVEFRRMRLFRSEERRVWKECRSRWS